jgi:hypothetical protein
MKKPWVLGHRLNSYGFVISTPLAIALDTFRGPLRLLPYRIACPGGPFIASRACEPCRERFQQQQPMRLRIHCSKPVNSFDGEAISR